MQLRGIFPALCTAFDERGNFDPARHTVLVERLIGQGVHGLFAAGTTGEFPSLSAPERERLLETVISAARGRVPVIVHVGSFDPREATRLARHAVAAGAAGVSAIPPIYYRLRDEEVLSHYRAVARAAEPLPFYVYHIPDLTRVPATRPLLEGLLGIPNFAGLKWSDPDLHGLGRAVELLGDRADILAGKDETLLPALCMGARGAIGSTYNFIAPWFVGVWDAFGKGDLAAARSLQARANRVIEVGLKWDPGPPSWKAGAHWVGTDCGDPRPPLRRFAPGELRALEKDLEASGVPRGGL